MSKFHIAERRSYITIKNKQNAELLINFQNEPGKQPGANDTRTSTGNDAAMADLDGRNE